jgi:hypothetical protein
MALNPLQNSNLFSRTSAFDGAGVEPPLDFNVVGVVPSDQQQSKIQDPAKKTTIGVHVKQIDDWIYRLKSIADEVGDSDHHLLAAESDLLDLRDELDHLLD